MRKTHSIPVQLIFSCQLIMLFSEAPYQLLCPNLRHLELKTYHFLTRKKTFDKMKTLRDDFWDCWRFTTFSWGLGATWVTNWVSFLRGVLSSTEWLSCFRLRGSWMVFAFLLLLEFKVYIHLNDFGHHGMILHIFGSKIGLLLKGWRGHLNWLIWRLSCYPPLKLTVRT